MKSKSISLAAVAAVSVVVLCGMSIVQAGQAKVDVTGKWAANVETSAGSGAPNFTFKQDGEKLTGHYVGTFGEEAHGIQWGEYGIVGLAEPGEGVVPDFFQSTVDASVGGLQAAQPARAGDPVAQFFLLDLARALPPKTPKPARAKRGA